jgi:outer membrane protein TolC
VADAHDTRQDSSAEAHTEPRVTEPDEETGLGGYLAYAAENNAGLRAAFHRYKAALERIPQVESLPDPRLSYRYYIREIETRVGAMRQGVGLSQTFPWIGTLELRGDVAAAEARAARLRFEAARLKLFHEVRDAYFEYYHLGRRRQIVAANLRLVRRMEEVARVRYRAAAASHPDVLRAQVELGKLEDRLASLEELRGPMTARLNAALNRPSQAELPWPEALPETELDADEDRMLGWIRAANPELKALESQVEAARTAEELARKAYFPNITLGLDYTELADSTGGRSPSDDGKDAVAVMLSMNLPIWYDKLRAGQAEARRRRLAAGLDRRQRFNELAARFKMALYEYRDARRKLALYSRTLVPKARQALRSTEAAFRGGTADFTALIDAERVLLEFELAAERAATTAAQRLSEIEMLTGRDLMTSPPADRE